MGQKLIVLGVTDNDGGGDTLKGGGSKINDNFTELYTLKAPLLSPALTGLPTTPTAAPGDNSTKIANTAFVFAAIAALINSSPSALDTLKELADALGDDPNFATTIATSLGDKLAKASNLSDLTNAGTARTNLGLVIGTNIQAWDTDLDAIAALSTTALGRSLLTIASAAAGRTILQLDGVITKTPSGRWIAPEGPGSPANTPATPGSGSMRFIPFRVRYPITINTVAVRVTTLAALGNIQIAVYAADATTLFPTGAPLATTASISVAALNSASGALAVTLQPGIYWFVTNLDNATAILSSTSTASTSVSSVIGSASASTALSSNTNLTGFSLAQTFGSWPTLTGTGTGSDGLVETTTATVPLVAYKVN